MPLQGPVYKTILLRHPCLDTHQLPTHRVTSPPTSSPTHTHRFTVSISCQARRRLEKSNFLVCLPPIYPQPKADISAFTTPPTLLLLHLTLPLLPEPLLSILTLIYHGWQAPALSLTPACQHQHGVNERANRSLLAVCRPAALNTTKTHSNTPSDSEHPSTHPQPYAEEGFVNERLLLPWHWNPCFPKPLWTENRDVKFGESTAGALTMKHKYVFRAATGDYFTD